MPAIVALDAEYLEDSAAYAELESAIVYPSDQIEVDGEEVSAIFYKINTNYQDSDGYLEHPNFVAVTNVDLDSLEIEDGEMSIQYIKFYDDVTGTTMTQYEPTVDLLIATSYLLESTYYADYEGAAELENSIGGHTWMYFNIWDADTASAAGAESTALKKRYGLAGASAYGGLGVDTAIETLTAEMASTTMQIEYNFKKSKFPTLSEKNLSAFETDEAAQDIDIETTMVATTTKSGTSY
jgi:hypothetical protein